MSTTKTDLSKAVGKCAYLDEEFKLCFIEGKKKSKGKDFQARDEYDSFFFFKAYSLGNWV